MSGFFKTDIDEISRLALKQSLKLIQQEFKNEWAVIALQKEN
jgi:ribosomal protein L11 methylase PrmA